MWKKKTIGAALACALAFGVCGSALATPITVGGITWDPADGSDLNIQAFNFREGSVAAVGDKLIGYGQIGQINGDTNFCSGCSLTFQFEYTLSAIEGTPTNPKVIFDNGTINFFVDMGGNFDVADPTTAGIGSSWLTLGGHTAPFTGFTALGQLYSTINGSVAAPGHLSGGFGLLDVTGGAAAYWMDTNSRDDGSDFDLSSAFSTQPYAQCTSISPNPADICHYPILGAGTLTGKSLTVPEPGTIGMLGLGLGFLGLALSRRRKESDDVA